VLHRLVCIGCGGNLDPDGDVVRCGACGTTYPVVGGLPVLLPPELSEQQLAQTRYFDAEFERYERYRPEAWRLSYNRRIFSALGIAGGAGPYLDVGVGGSGATVIEAAKLGVEATGCDLSIAGVRQAKTFAEAEGVSERTRFVACAAESLPFADGSFRCASAGAVLEHLDDDSAAARELARVLRPGARLWVTVPLAMRHVPRVLRPLYRRHDRKLGHKRHYDEEGLVRLLDDAGFEHVATSYTGHPVKLLQLGVNRLPAREGGLRDRAWWALERADLRADARPTRALQLSGVFRT
jgi:ubiquinone/menaquinone biosynthesis C-methylase UbiE